MKIKVIIPNASAQFDADVFNMYSQVKDENTELEVCHIAKGSLYLNQRYDEIWSEPSVLLEAEKAEKDGFDGVLVYCALDPARTAMREALHIPVVSIFEVAVHTAAMLGNHISLLCPPGSIAAREELVRMYQMEQRMTSLEFFSMDISGLSEDREAAYRIVKKAALTAMEKGADILILGCGAIMGSAGRLQEELGIPVIEPGPIALKYCEALIELGLRHSKVAYASPQNSLCARVKELYIDADMDRGRERVSFI